VTKVTEGALLSVMGVSDTGYNKSKEDVKTPHFNLFVYKVIKQSCEFQDAITTKRL